MGSLEAPTTAENGSATVAGGGKNHAVAADEVPLRPAEAVEVASEAPAESDKSKKRRMAMLPLEVGTRVLCRWRDSKYHPVKVIERRKMPTAGPNDYEYYVHYTECKTFTLFVFNF